MTLTNEAHDPSLIAPSSRAATGDLTAYSCSPSTRWTWKKVKIDSPLAAQRAQRRKAPQKPSLSRWEGRDPLSIGITYRGGAEAWYEVKARGRSWRFPGHIALHDAMQRIYEG